MLNKFGYNVLQASNGDEAIEIYKNQYTGINIIILDMIMPKMGGKNWKSLNEILKINPEAKVIISSGFSADKTDESDISRLIKGFIHKPYEVKYLLSTIREALDGLCLL